MLAPLGRSAPTCFSWLTIPEYVPAVEVGITARNTIEHGPLLVLLNYYSSVSSFNLAPALNEAFNENAHNPGITHAEVPRDCWKPVWDEETASFYIQKASDSLDASFWRWIGCRIFERQQLLYKQLEPCISPGNALSSIPLFPSATGHRFFSYRMSGDKTSPPLDLMKHFRQQLDLVGHLQKIQWEATRTFQENYTESPLSQKKNNKPSHGPKGSHLEGRRDRRLPGAVSLDIQSLLKELAQNQESLRAVVALCSGDTDVYSARGALAESANKLLELIEPMLSHTVFLAPGRFRQDSNPQAMPTAFPVSLHAEISFQQAHKNPNTLFSLIPRDTPKISKPNLSVGEGMAEDELIKKQNNGYYYQKTRTGESEGNERPLTVPLLDWQHLVQNGYGYERIFQDGKIHDFKKWNRLWATLDGWYNLKGLKNGEDLTNIGFDSTLYLFPPEPSIDVLYKSYQLAIKTVEKKQTSFAQKTSLGLLATEGRDILGPCLLQDMVKKPKGFQGQTSVYALLKANQTDPDPTPHETMVQNVLFRETMNCLGLLKEQVLGGEAEEADHFGLNTHQRLFCQMAIQPSSSPLIALNGPPGTGKTTVLQAVVASEVVQAALKQQPMPIIVGASATHQAKSNIIGGFQHNVVHPDGSTSQGIWHRWLNPLPKKYDPIKEKEYPPVESYDYGLELSEQGTLSERLGRLKDHHQNLTSHWHQCFKDALSHSLESSSQRALRRRLNDLFEPHLEPQVPTHLSNTGTPLHAIHFALEQWWKAAGSHEEQAGGLIRKANQAASLFDQTVSELSVQWKSLDDGAQRFALNTLEEWLYDPSSLSLQLSLEHYPLLADLLQQKEVLLSSQSQNATHQEELFYKLSLLTEEEKSLNEMAWASEEKEAHAEWKNIADAYNRCFGLCPSFLMGMVWRFKTTSLQQLIRKATKGIGDRSEKQQRRKAYWKHLVELQKTKQQANSLELPDGISIKINPSNQHFHELQALEERWEEHRQEQRQTEANDKEIERSWQLIQEDLDALEDHFLKQQAILNRIASFFLASTSLTAIEGILGTVERASRPGSMDQRKLRACQTLVAGNGDESLLKQAIDSITQGIPLQRNATSIADDIANILGAWVDNAYKPTCFHLAARWHEGKALEEIAQEKSFSKLPNQEELTRRLQTMARIHPIMVSTLHAIGNRMAIKEQGESLTGIGTIDLLVVDEAGQVPMTLGGLGLLLTKRCLAVGDRDQLEPIWEIEAEDDTALFKTLAKIPKEALSPTEFALMGWDCHAGSLLTLVQAYTPWSPYHGVLQRGLYLLEHNRCPIEIISYCDALSYQGQLRCKITSHYKQPNRQADYHSFLTTHNDAWGGKLLNKMSIQQCQNRALFLNNPVPHPISIIEHAHEDTSNGSRMNDGEALAILEWLDQHFETLTKGRGKGGADVPIADRVAIITPFTAQAMNIFDKAKSEDFEWKHSGLQRHQIELLFNSDRKNKTTEGPNKTLTIGTVHSLQGAEVDIVLFSNVYGQGSAGNQTFQDRNPQIMNVAVSRAKQAFVLFANRGFIAGIKHDQPSAMGLLVHQIRMLEREKNL
jgi:hypothetical protein